MSDKFVIYTSASIPECIFCDRAKQLLKENAISYTEIVIGRDITKNEFLEQYGNDIRTVPQIIINGTRIGGYDALSRILLKTKTKAA